MTLCRRGIVWRPSHPHRTYHLLAVGRLYFFAQTAETAIRADIPNSPVDCGLFAVNPSSIR